MSVLAMAPSEQTQAALPPSMVERMTLILDLFAGDTEQGTDPRDVWLPLDRIARGTGLPRSTSHRILEQLVRLQWLDHSPAGYGLGRRAHQLGGGAAHHDDLRAAASPHLHELLLRTGAVIHLGVLEGAQVRYLDKLGGRFAVNVPSRVGGTAPAHCTALGKAMLAWLPAEDVDELVGRELAPRTPSSVSQLPALHQQLTRIRGRHGLALEHGEYVPEISCVAAAVRSPRGPVGALSVVAATGTTLERVGPLVLDAARRIAADL
ncbi:IclR family transcriptional regulator [Nocardioides caeni]|uniref:IclR family transcriptional regulator n=2 Tax=Nocardioides caeni TaxID=574700 RepID=A0A4S8NIM9_9ACTN|nr:IclR family transcriptional regulator [Nocardioides caeni]